MRQQITLPIQTERVDADVLHLLSAAGPLSVARPIIATIYDTLEFTTPLPSPRNAKRWVMRLYNRFVQTGIAKKSEKVITISEYSKQQIVAHFHLPSEQVVVIYLAPSNLFRRIDRSVAVRQLEHRYGEVRRYVLGFASAEPRKNARNLIEAYSHLRVALQAKYPLVLVCTHASAESRLALQAEDLGIRQRVMFIEQPSDEDLLLLYNAASLFVFPSLEEGFGLPPLEAMACGTPVIASNTSSMPEVLGDAALLVSPTDIRALASAMNDILTSPHLSDQLAERGLQRSRMLMGTHRSRNSDCLRTGSRWHS